MLSVRSAKPRAFPRLRYDKQRATRLKGVSLHSHRGWITRELDSVCFDARPARGKGSFYAVTLLIETLISTPIDIRTRGISVKTLFGLGLQIYLVYRGLAKGPIELLNYCQLLPRASNTARECIRRTPNVRSNGYRSSFNEPAYTDISPTDIS